MSSQAAARELSVSRFINAAPASVYRVWTERLGEWWAPRPHTTPGVDIEFRPGGRACIVTQSPDGRQLRNEGVVLEVVPDRKIVITDAFTADWTPHETFMVAIFTFEPQGSGTRYTARVRHWSEEAKRLHDAIGFKAGWKQCADQLAELAEPESAAAAA